MYIIFGIILGFFFFLEGVGGGGDRDIIYIQAIAIFDCHIDPIFKLILHA